MSSAGEQYAVGVSIVERDVAGEIFRVYSGLITIDAVQIDFAAQTFSIAESATGGASVGTLDASASDNRTITFAATHPVFDVDGNTGEITLAAGQSLDHETTAGYVITVTAGALDVEPVTQSITINIDDVLENAITFAAETFSIAEDAAPGDLVGTLNGSASPAGTVTFAATHPAFDVTSTGEITLAAGQSLDHEAQDTYTIEVTAGALDAEPVTQSITINIDDVLENAITFAAETFSIAEDAAPGDLVGTLNASASPAGTVTFTATHAVFDVDDNTGEITLAAGQSLDHEAQDTYTIEVTASADDANPDATQSITINIDDVLENAITFAAETFSIAEDAAPGDLVGTLNASVSPAGTVTFTVTHPVFDVASTGEITLAAGQSLDHETTTSYAITVTAGALDAEPVTQSITINVDDVPENVITFAAETFSIAEDAAPGDLVGTLSASASPAGMVTFAATHAVFDVASTGEITLAAGQSLDHEAQDTYTIEVTASAEDASNSVQNVIVNVVNIDQEGTADKPYQVDSLAELQSIATGFQNEALATPLSEADSLAAHYVLTADIDATLTASGTWQMSVDDGGTSSDTSDDVVQHGFLPIGNCGADNDCFSTDDDEPFTGSFDGAGHAIDGLHIDRSTTRGVGLFGRTSSTTVLRDVALEGGSISGDRFVGGLVGSNWGTVQDSFATGSGSGDRFVGGLAGYNDSSGTIQDSYAPGSVSGGIDVGGLVGRNWGTVQDSFATGSVSGAGDRVGGLVGYNGGTIQDSYATGTVSGTGDYVGGLVGYNDGGTVQDSYASGLVSGGSDVGGLVGRNWGSGTVARGYCVDGTIADSSGVDDGEADCVGDGASTDVSLVTLDALEALTCSGSTASVFLGDHDGDDPDGDGLKDDDTTPATVSIDCASAGAANFPWDFGDSNELPVLNGATGLLGGVLDADGQRALIAFARAERTADGSASTIDAPSTTKQDATHTLSYHWGVVSGSVSITSGDDSSTVGIEDAADGDVLSISIIERDADGAIVRVYGGVIVLDVPGS